MSKKALGRSTAAIGLLVVLFFALADVVGAGSSPGFGIKQWLGMIVGALLVGAGVLISRR